MVYGLSGLIAWHLHTCHRTSQSRTPSSKPFGTIDDMSLEGLRFSVFSADRHQLAARVHCASRKAEVKTMGCRKLLVACGHCLQ